MGGATHWPVPQNLDGWMRQMEKRTLGSERRPLIRNAADILGPGIAPFAVLVGDWNDEVTLFNGIFYSEPTALNSPDGAAYWMGFSFANPDGFGFQRVWEFRESATALMRVFERSFSSADGEQRAFEPWLSVGEDTDTGWLNLPLGTGWSAGPHQPSYRRVGSRVYLRGNVVRPAGSNTTVASLPAGFTPAIDMGLTVRTDSAPIALAITAAGTIGIGTTYTNGDNAELDNIQFFND